MRLPHVHSAVCLSVGIAASLLSRDARATVVLSSTSYSENFDDPKLTAPTTGAWSATSGTQAAVPGTSGWDGVKLSGTGTTAMNFTLDNGAGNSGALYSYGATGSGERALGTLASGTNIPGFGVELKNSTGAVITSVTISYTGEFWRSSTSSAVPPAGNVLNFAYETGAAGSTTYLSDVAATAFAALNLVGPAPVTANAALDGNLPANQASFSGTISGLNIAVGQSLYIRWQDTNDLGNDAGLAVDNFSLTAVTAPEPATFVLFAVGAMLLAVRRRRSSH